MMNIDEVLEQADLLAASQSPDDAARFLAPFRKSACEAISSEPSRIGDLLQISSAQMQFLLDAGSPEKATGIAEWFLHILHHLEESIQDVDFRNLKRALRDSFSRFFRRYARALRDLERFEDMRLAMRTSLDLTTQLPMTVVAMVHIYSPLLKLENVEGENGRDWLLKRCAEALAALDFSGLHDIPFRAALDNFQYALRSPEYVQEASVEMERIFIENSGDITIKTLYNLFKTII